MVEEHIHSAQQGEERVKLFCNMAAQMSHSLPSVTLDTTKTSFDSSLWNPRQPTLSPIEWFNMNLDGAGSWECKSALFKIAGTVYDRPGRSRFYLQRAEPNYIQKSANFLLQTHTDSVEYKVNIFLETLIVCGEIGAVILDINAILK